MDGIVAFDYSFFLQRYSELAYIAESLLQLYFNEAGLYCDNTANSPIQDSTVGGQRYLLLHMATAHIAFMNSPPSAGGTASQLVGRIQSATQGSVSVSTQNDYPPGSAQWWQQTKYGAAFWASSTQFRLFRYRRGCRRNLDPFSPIQG